MPRTFPFLFEIPAIFSNDPLGLYIFEISPEGEEYLNII